MEKSDLEKIKEKWKKRAKQIKKGGCELG